MNEIPQTRQSLLIALRNQSEDAWSEFLSVYEDALFKFCRAKGLQAADAHDVVQEVLQAVFDRIATWDPDRRKGSFRGWLFRVARNIAVDTIASRAKKTNATGDSRVADLLMHVPNQSIEETSFDIEYRKSLFDWASNQVRPEVLDVTWKAFRMTAVDGMKAEQVAKVLEIPIGSVYTSKCRVVARIKAKISELESETDPILGSDPVS